MCLPDPDLKPGVHSNPSCRRTQVGLVLRVSSLACPWVCVLVPLSS